MRCILKLMTFGYFILGLIVMILGFTMVWRTNRWDEFFGSFEYAVGISWLSWKTVGIIIIFVGFLVAFGLIQAFIVATLGRFFTGFGTVR